MQLSSRQASLLVATNAALLSVLIFTAAVPAGRRFSEISAERINIVDKSGKLVMAISNKARIAPPAMDGKTYAVETSSGRENMAGMIFFNDEGDEMGGLVFNSFRLPNGKSAGIGHLSFDRFKDNQVLALQYKENSTSVQSGLTLYDRPSNGKFKTSLDLTEEYGKASPARKAEIEAITAEMRAKGDFGYERVFLGSKDKAAQLILRDTSGKPRVRMVVSEDNSAALEFLSPDGKVVARCPEN